MLLSGRGCPRNLNPESNPNPTTIMNTENPSVEIAEQLSDLPQDARRSHTPGPFEVRPTSRPGNGSAWRDIVSVGVPYSPCYVGEALERDAYLFAAAPDLLAALEQARAALPDAWAAVKCDVPREVLELIDAAIAKAKGGES